MEYKLNNYSYLDSLLKKNILLSFSLFIIPVIVGGVVVDIISHYYILSNGLSIGIKFFPIWLTVLAYNANDVKIWGNRKFVFYGFLVGVVFVIIPMLASFLTASVLAGKISATIDLSLLGGWYLFGRIIQASSEEIVFRGVILHKLAEEKPEIAIQLTSITFVLLHVFNTGFNIGAGIITYMFAVAMAKISLRRGVWWCVGFHIAWNYFTMAFVPLNQTTTVLNAVMQFFMLFLLLEKGWFSK